ncbi:MAG: pyridoxamine 5'-phosphate oxidase [Bdellovibrionales bacterium]|nr:pyridoxamine 5'-phosphate oxidase [Bdellovibrionales bacterium]
MNILEKDPLQLAQEWIDLAKEKSNMTYANAMSLATVNSAGEPSIRIVLLKELNAQGFVFFTNYNSRKGREIAANPHVAANFYWDKTFRQLKVLGTIKKISPADSQAYWQTRPRESQLSQYVSQQSQPVESREHLDELYNQAEQELAGKEIACPQHWGGYIITPKEMEFWIGREHRFHDRFQFKITSSGEWLGQRLFP